MGIFCMVTGRRTLKVAHNQKILRAPIDECNKCAFLALNRGFPPIARWL